MGGWWGHGYGLENTGYLTDGLVSATLGLFVLEALTGGGEERRGKKGGETRNLIDETDETRQDGKLFSFILFY